ncbi:MAG TPA: CPBP family intramembrane glutamic endopeptidase [Anaerolineales bacterium]|nr:CPBP family intramembrane glutamic endopeptidase [Anaerolineales bacterium]
MNINPLNSTSKGKSLLAFFSLAVALYVPIAIYADVQVFPNWALINFGAFIPMLVALILVYRENGTASMVELLKRPFDFKRIKSKIWYLPIFLIIPLTVLAQYGLALLFGLPVSSPYLPSWSPLLFAILFIAAIGEELGLMGYVIEPMQERFGALNASILLGIVQASYHILLFTSSGMSSHWIVWQLIYIAATRVLYAWIYNNTGKSIFAVVTMHTLFNMVWFLFPRNTAWVTLARPVFYNPAELAVITIVLATIVTFLWGSKTLARYRFASSSQPSVEK